MKTAVWQCFYDCGARIAPPKKNPDDNKPIIDDIYEWYWDVCKGDACKADCPLVAYASLGDTRRVKLDVRTNVTFNHAIKSLARVPEL